MFTLVSEIKIFKNYAKIPKQEKQRARKWSVHVPIISSSPEQGN